MESYLAYFQEFQFGVISLTEIEKLPVCRMTPETYERYKVWYLKVKEQFENSKSQMIISPVGSKIGTEEKILYRGGQYSEVSYGDTNLFEAGCAIFCIEQVMRAKGIAMPIDTLASVITNKGYHESNKGTWHHLFDRLGAHRMVDANGIMTELNNKNIITVLLENHYVNIIGYKEDRFIISDSKNPEMNQSKFGKMLEIPIKGFIKQIKICWAW